MAGVMAPRTIVLSAPDPVAGHCRATPLLETPGPSQASLAQSLVGSQLLSLGSWCTQSFVCALEESVSQSCGSSVIKSHWPPKSNSSVFLSPFVRFPGWEISCRPRTFATVQDLLWYNCSPVYGLSVWWLYMALMVTSTKRTDAACCASHICCSQSPCPRGRPLLIHASAGDPQILRGRSGSVSCCNHQSFPLVLVLTRFVCALQEFLACVWIDLDIIAPLLPSPAASPLSLGVESLFFGWFQYTSFDGC